jgi:hypothetical protein
MEQELQCIRSPCGGINDKPANSTHLGAEGTGVFGMGAHVPTQINSFLVPASSLPAVARSGCVPGLPPAASGWLPLLM